MKTTNLTYIEAVQALKDGKCKGIKRPLDFHPGSYLFFKEDRSTLSRSLRLEWNTGSETYAYDSHILAIDWELVDPIIKIEESGILKKGSGPAKLNDQFLDDLVDLIVHRNKELIGRNVKLTIETID